VELVKNGCSAHFSPLFYRPVREHPCVVGVAGSFQAAADRLNMDRSVLSRRIAALEAELGTRLLQRSTRALSVTAAGQGLLDKARSLRDLLNEVQQIAEESHETLRGRLRVTAPTHFGHLYVQEALERFLYLRNNSLAQLVIDLY